MKNILKITLLLSIIFGVLFATPQENDKAIKPHHKEVQMDCRDCHGNVSKENYKSVETLTCLQCHSSKEKLADRLKFLGKKNPHNSIHDGQNLNCYSCHNEHKPSYNMCTDCHNTSKWMREIK